jgi:hypothetical protein
MPARPRFQEGIMDDRAEEVALLAAQIAADFPTLHQALHTSVGRVSHSADRLEAELRMYSPLEAILNSAIRYVEARTGRYVDEQLLMLLFDRLGVNDARLAIERIKEMDLDSIEPG